MEYWCYRCGKNTVWKFGLFRNPALIGNEVIIYMKCTGCCQLRSFKMEKEKYDQLRRENEID